MGCCCSKDDESQCDYNDRSRLLNNPVGDDPNQSITGYGSTSPGHQENQKEKALNNIITKTARNIIDISALETQIIQPNDYQDRIKAYHNALNAIDVHKLKSEPNELNRKMPQVAILKRETDPDLHDEIGEFARTVEALINDIHMEKREPLVVPFYVPPTN